MSTVTSSPELAPHTFSASTTNGLPAVPEQRLLHAQESHETPGTISTLAVSGVTSTTVPVSIIVGLSWRSFRGAVAWELPLL